MVCDYLTAKAILDGRNLGQLTDAQLAEFDNRLGVRCSDGIDEACRARRKLRAAAVTKPPSPKAAERSSGNRVPEESERKNAAEIDERIKTVRVEAKRLAEGNGASTARLARQVLNCRNGLERCEKAAVAMENKVAGLTGIALYLVAVPVYATEESRMKGLLQMEPKVARAEKYIEQAKVAAEKNEERRMAQQATLRAEAGDQANADAECAKSLALCKKRCDEGTAAFCAALGLKLAEAKSPKFTEGIEALKNACDSGCETGCMWLGGVQKDSQLYSQKTESLWSNVEAAVDSIAEKKHIAKFAQQNLRGRRNARAMQRVKQHIAALIKESYCPAVNAFKAERSQAEFTKLAKEHCDDRAPTGTGLSGSVVTLTAECRSTYLTHCPAPKPKAKPTKSSNAPDFVPACGGNMPWMFSPARWLCQCGVEIRDPCKSRGCEIRPSKNDTCGCDCNGDGKVTLD